MTAFVLAIDQGTTSTRCMVFDDALRVRGVGQQEIAQSYPQAGWVEHDPDEILASVRRTFEQALSRAGIAAGDLTAIGITNQRETTVIWDRANGRPIAPAIVWQDRRTADVCRELAAAGGEADVTRRTGLLLDPYFSATKIAWLLDNVVGARARADAGALAFGTIDSWVLWHLTGGASHATDVTNASRTNLFDISRLDWDDDLLALFRVPRSLLPEVRGCDAVFGTTARDVIGAAVPVCGIAGDQQAAAIGQACFAPGMIKATYGTGCFALLNTGGDRVASRHRLLTTIAYRIGDEVAYALEGSIFVAGAAVQWLRDGLGVIAAADEAGRLALQADPGQQVYLVPAFTGLGAPYWDAEARGALFGMTRNTGPKELARAALESVAYQTADLIDAMAADWPRARETVLRVDGGMTASDYTLQRIADFIDAPVDRPHGLETTATGAAWLAGQAAGVMPERAAFARAWSCERRFVPELDASTRSQKRAGWRDAVERTRSRPLAV